MGGKIKLTTLKYKLYKEVIIMTQNITRHPLKVVRNPILGEHSVQSVRGWINEQFGSLRTLTINTQIWFVGADAAKALQYKNPTNAIIRHVKPKYKLVASLPTFHKNVENTITPISESQRPLGINRIALISEAGLYALIAHSHMPKAEEFMEWVYDEVLPSLRKYDMYATDEGFKRLHSNPSYLDKVESELQQLRQQNKRLREEAQQLKIKADYTTLTLLSDETVPITRIAKEFGVSGYCMNRLAQVLHLQYAMGNSWYPYEEHANEGLTVPYTFTFKVNGNVKSNTVLHWTHSGRFHLHQILAELGIYPVYQLDEHQRKTQKARIWQMVRNA